MRKSIKQDGKVWNKLVAWVCWLRGGACSVADDVDVENNIKCKDCFKCLPKINEVELKESCSLEKRMERR